MNYAAIRELLAHSPETRFAEVVIGNPNEIWSELRGLMAERDRAVELLQRVWGCLGVKGCLSSAEKYLRTCGETGPVLKDEVHEFLGELEGE